MRRTSGWALENAWVYHRYHGRQFCLDQFTRDSGVAFRLDTMADGQGRLSSICVVITSSHPLDVVSWALGVIGRLLAFPFADQIVTKAVPDAPAAPTLTVSGTAITATWPEPEDNHDAITAYGVQYKLSSASSWTDVAEWPD